MSTRKNESRAVGRRLREQHNPSAQELAKQIEQLVENFIASSRDSATAALERAFASAVGDRRAPRVAPPRRRSASPRRSPDAIVALSERLYEAVCGNPGETMSVLGPALGATPRALQVPAARLKKAGRIRSVGQRRFARYFPMVKGAARSS